MPSALSAYVKRNDKSCARRSTSEDLLQQRRKAEKVIEAEDFEGEGTHMACPIFLELGCKTTWQSVALCRPLYFSHCLLTDSKYHRETRSALADASAQF